MNLNVPQLTFKRLALVVEAQISLKPLQYAKIGRSRARKTGQFKQKNTSNIGFEGGNECICNFKRSKYFKLTRVIYAEVIYYDEGVKQLFFAS